MACDGDIAPEEVELVRQLCASNAVFEGLDIEQLLNEWISTLNTQGADFLADYLRELTNAPLTEEEQLQVVDLAFKTIEADHEVRYAEVKFFKKIRSRLAVLDEAILKLHPDKEDFLLPDINVLEAPEWDNKTQLNKIELHLPAEAADVKA